MSFSFPKSSLAAAQHITPDVMVALERWQELPSRLEAAGRSKRFCETSGSGATGVYSMTLLADDSVALCFFGIRGGFRQIWNFGKA